MNYIILCDLRDNNGKITFIKDGDENIKIFTDAKDLADCIENQILCKTFPYYIIDLDNMDIIIRGD